MKSQDEIVKESLVVDAPVERIWSIADNPSKLAGSVPFLGRFESPPVLEEHARLSETHTILGWPQKYSGSVTKLEKHRCWAMSSFPVGFGPAPLPHDVEYSFTDRNGRTEVSILCNYRREGLLRLPFFGRWIVRRLMQSAILGLLDVIAQRAKDPEPTH